MMWYIIGLIADDKTNINETYKIAKKILVIFLSASSLGLLILCSASFGCSSLATHFVLQLKFHMVTHVWFALFLI
jgi:hypothetical protein